MRQRKANNDSLMSRLTVVLVAWTIVFSSSYSLATPSQNSPASQASASPNTTATTESSKATLQGPGAVVTGTPADSGQTPDGQNLRVLVGRSLFVNVDERLRRVYVSNPAVLEAITTTPHQLVITAKTAGTSSLVLWKENGESIIYTVLADIDASELEQSLQDAFPGDQIQVRSSQGKVYLSGVVGSPETAEQAGQLAAAYSKSIVNSLVVSPRHEPQVKLEVRFAEIDRSKLDSFGINLIGLNSQSIASGSTQQYSAPAFQNNNGKEEAIFSDFLNLFYFNITHGVGASIKDLETKGVLEILAEPTLMTISGQPAKFLAGGEFPFPVVQPGSGPGASTVTVQFRPYGVKLDFTPFVNSDGTIRLKVAPEVSALDYTNVVIISGYTIPSLSTRHVETEVELKNGQTFGISGILDRRTTDSFSKMPGIGDIPILGQLFRSKGQNHSVMELVVMVTATVVDPLTQTNDAPVPTPVVPIPFMNPPAFDRGLPKSSQAPQSAPQATFHPNGAQ